MEGGALAIPKGIVKLPLVKQLLTSRHEHLRKVVGTFRVNVHTL